MYFSSVGIVIPDLLKQHSSKDRLEAIRMNAVQISQVYHLNADSETVMDVHLALKLHEEWLGDFGNDSRGATDLEVRAEKIAKLYYSGIRAMTQKLTKFMSSYDFYALYVGIWLLLQSLLGLVCLHLHLYPTDLSTFLSEHSGNLKISFFVTSSMTGFIHVNLCSSKPLGNVLG